MKTAETPIISHPFLSEMHLDHLELLTTNARQADYDEGDILFRQGEPAELFYLVQSGRIVLEHGTSKPFRIVESLGIGEVVGWSWLFPPFTWHFQARAVKPSHVVILDGSHILAKAEENASFGYALMKRVTKLALRRLELNLESLTPST